MSFPFPSVTAAVVLSMALGLPVLSAQERPSLQSPPVEPRFSYASPYTGLDYRFETASRTPDGTVTAFEMSTSAGVLTGRIAGDDSFGRIVLEHSESGMRTVVDLVASVVPGRGEIHVAFPERDEHIYYRVDDRSTTPLTASDATGPDCATLEQTDLRLAHAEALRLFTADLDLSPDPPGHLKEIGAALFYADSLVGTVDGCATAHDLMAGACHLDHDDYGPCADCCEQAGDLAEAICGGALYVGCPTPWCRVLGRIVCGGLRELQAGGCVHVMCKGKKGDPDCPSWMQCGEVPGSSCWQFCGITQKSVCGKCPDRESCCAPM